MMEITISIGAIITGIIGFFLRRAFADLDKTNSKVEMIAEKLNETKTKLLLVETNTNNGFANLTDKILEVKVALTDILVELKEIRKNGLS
jgi:hypothetical protein